MKIPSLVPALVVVQAALAPAIFAQTFVDDLTGNVSTMNLNLTVTETTGGYLVTSAKKAADLAKGVQYPDFLTYDTTFGLNPPGPAILNPINWDNARGNNYVERQTAATNSSGSPVVTAQGSYKISRTRYTTASLIADLAEAEIIPSPAGYRIVAVRFDTPVPEVVYNNGTYLTVVRRGLYFFAERAPARGVPDPAPVYLGAEDNVYAYPQIIDFASYESAEQGKYTDVFTGGQNGFEYNLVAESSNGVALGEFSIFRRPNAAQYYEMRVGGVFNWAETYNAKRVPGGYDRGATVGNNLSGPGTLYLLTDTNNDSVPDTFQASSSNEAVVTGGISLPAAKFEPSLLRYLNKLPRKAD